MYLSQKGASYRLVYSFNVVWGDRPMSIFNRSMTLATFIDTSMSCINISSESSTSAS
jgi:hypothetical protein